ncbi:MAG: hypothetical protein JRJ66_01620 [Deltaproteobacteria bacterium]|nr:hypothetical protein [Deltaproteobacteria bacterium]MBW2081656.1 hypothetical protein [Deltaproteobacteria bacterium]MBW2298851.1 hypothetical protein [Deltaproteobacteria bacterium]
MLKSDQLALFRGQSINPTHEIKRQIRIALSSTRFSRDEVVDQINRIAAQEGIKRSISKATLDSWCKDSDHGRMPSPAWMTILCQVLGTTAPIEAMLRPLGCAVLDEKGMRVMVWAEAELEKRQAAKRARLALEVLNQEKGIKD